MLQKLINFLILLVSFKKKKVLIPDSFSNDEKIARSIFSPINLTKDLKSIKANAFKPPSGLDEISVNRLNYTTETFCKQISVQLQNPEYKKNYFGLGLLYVNEIYESDCDIVYTPLKTNPSHSDIKIGYIPQKGEPLPGEFLKKTKNLANKARLFQDFNLDSDKWEGEPIK